MNNVTDRQTANERLLKLAGIVENYEVFDATFFQNCTVGLARKMYQEETGERPLGIAHRDIDIAEYFGLSVVEVDAIYCGNFGKLDIGMEDLRLRFISRHIAADVLRRLAARG